MKSKRTSPNPAHVRLARALFTIGNTDVTEDEVTPYLARLQTEADAAIEGRLKVDPAAWEQVCEQQRMCEEHFQPDTLAAMQARLDETLAALAMAKSARNANVIVFRPGDIKWAGERIALLEAAKTIPNFEEREVEIPGIPGKARLTVERREEGTAFVTLTAHESCAQLLGSVFVLRLKDTELGRIKFSRSMASIVAKLSIKRCKGADKLLEMTIEPNGG